MWSVNDVQSGRSIGKSPVRRERKASALQRDICLRTMWDWELSHMTFQTMRGYTWKSLNDLRMFSYASLSAEMYTQWGHILFSECPLLLIIAIDLLLWMPFFAENVPYLQHFLSLILISQGSGSFSTYIWIIKLRFSVGSRDTGEKSHSFDRCPIGIMFICWNQAAQQQPPTKAIFFFFCLKFLFHWEWPLLFWKVHM